MRGKKLAALSLFAASTVVLSACSGTGELTLDVPDVPMVDEVGAFEGELNIVNWSGFVEPAWTDQFTADTGCVVNPRVAGTSDEMVTLMRTGE